jgi:hypothetical protein
MTTNTCCPSARYVSQSKAWLTLLLAAPFVPSACIAAPHPLAIAPLRSAGANHPDLGFGLFQAAGLGAPDEVLSLPLASASPGSFHPDQAYSGPRLYFERNDGQTDKTVKFLARGPGHTLFLTPAELVMSLYPTANLPRCSGGRDPFQTASDRPVPKSQASPAVFRIRLLGANTAVAIQAQEELRGRVNYFLGNDPAQWRTNVLTCARVRYSEIYPGIDLVYYGHEGRLEYDFVVAPGANPAVITLAIAGADRVQVAPEGDLLVGIAGEEIRCRRPVVYQQIHGERRFLGGKYLLDPELNGGTSRLVRFAVEQTDPSIELVIDPELIYSTYLGGGGVNSGILFAYGDVAYDMKVDTQGNAYLTGYTQTINSLGFPTKDPIQTAAGDFDAFVTKLSPAGDLIYSTYLGGAGEDRGEGIAIDSAGSAYVTGWTASSDFPTANAVQPNYPGAGDIGDWDAFVTKLNPQGSALAYSTYLGGKKGARTFAIAVDGSGNACVAGRVDGGDLPIVNAIQPTFGGGSVDGFLAKLNSDGSKMIYSTYFGGSGLDQFHGIAVDQAGNACIVGTTDSADFPIKNAVQPRLAGKTDGCFVKLTPEGELAFSSYLGGSGYDYLWTIALAQNGDLILGGQSNSADFPLVKSFKSTVVDISTFATGVLARLKADGSQFIFSTYAGSTWSSVLAVTLDSAGQIYIGGAASSADLPNLEAVQSSLTARADGFLQTLSQDGSQLLFSTYFGGSSYGDQINSVAIDSAGDVYVAGLTQASDFPIQNALQPALVGTQNAFVAKLTPVGHPAVQITRMGQTLIISWPVRAGNFRLEAADSLFPQSTWTAISTQAAVISDENVITLTADQAEKFYRLRQF